MCDYSLENVPSRAAQVGERLVTREFEGSMTRGFASPSEPDVAVCLLPGTELAFEEDALCDHPLGLYQKRKLREKTARFRQVNMSSPYEHHDALEFACGRVVLLTRLSIGQYAAVLQLPSQAHAVEAARQSALRAPDAPARPKTLPAAT
jgi:hypothetical protein